MAQTVGGADIVFFRIPICSKCRAVARNLEAVKEEHPEIAVRELNLLFNIGLAKKHGLMTVPALLIRGEPLTGIVSKETIMEKLGLGEPGMD